MPHQTEFLTLLRRHEPALRAVVAMLVREAQLREDVWQEVTVALWRSFGGYDAARPFGPWARTVAVRQVLKVLRGHRRESAFPADTAELTMPLFEARDEQMDERREALRRCVEMLPAGSRRLLTLRYVEERACPEIAGATGQSLDAVHQSLSRLRARLGECIRRRMAQAELESTPLTALATL
jgi:RNA polymerase sigma-70 factor, ECF subfamily